MTVAFGSAGWLALHRELCAQLPAQAGATVRAEFVVTGTPDGDLRYHLAFEDGRLVASGVGPDPGAEVTLTVPYGRAREILGGRISLSTAYMQGDVKAAGHTGRLLTLLALQRSAAYRAVEERLAEQVS